MKKKNIFIKFGVITLFILIGISLVTSYEDSARVRAGIEPKYTYKIINDKELKITYIGLGYKVIRYVEANPYGPFSKNDSIKYGGWFMKYEKTVKNNDDDTAGDITENAITLNIKDGTLTKDGVTIILKNNTETNYTYGQDYYIQKYEKGKWKEASTLTGDPLAWNDIAYVLKPSESKEIKIDFKSTYGSLNEGKYRIIKRISKDNDTPITKDEVMIISVEFNIAN